MNGYLPSDNPTDVDLLPTDRIQFTESVTWEGETLTIVANASAIGLEEGRDLTLRYEHQWSAAWSRGHDATGETQFAPKGCIKSVLLTSAFEISHQVCHTTGPNHDTSTLCLLVRKVPSDNQVQLKW